MCHCDHFVSQFTVTCIDSKLFILMAGVPIGCLEFLCVFGGATPTGVKGQCPDGRRRDTGNLLGISPVRVSFKKKGRCILLACGLLFSLHFYVGWKA